MAVYLLHFRKKLHHAKHYIGFAEDHQLDDRIKKHRKGNGSSLTKAFHKEGIRFTLARVWPGKSRKFERKLKNRKKASSLCPVCQREKNRIKAIRAIPNDPDRREPEANIPASHNAPIKSSQDPSRS